MPFDLPPNRSLHKPPPDKLNGQKPGWLVGFIKRWPRLWSLAQRLVKFGLVGASGFVIDMTIYTLLASVIGVPHLLARGTSYWGAATWNWFWNRVFTFADATKARKVPQWGKYLGMCIISFIPNWGTYYLLTSHIPFFYQYKPLALVMGVGAGMMFNFTIASLFIFSRQR